MLHVPLRGRQVRASLAALCVAAALCAALPQAALADRAADSAQAAMLARSGQHGEAARLYEQAARRGFFSWDARLALLAAREYSAARQYDDAARMLDKAEGRARGDDAVLLATVEAEIALARNDPERALAALHSLPEPWPAPLAPDLLVLRSRAEFASGRTLAGVRSLEERGRILGAADARAANERLLASELAQHPPSTAAPAGASERERGWLELGVISAAATNADPAAVAGRSADWLSRHPDHPGRAYLPGATGPGRAAMPGAQADRSLNTVALLLPLSGRQAAAGIAVRDGAMAACFNARVEDRPRIAVYDTAALGPAAAYKQAVADGASVVIGPLTREDVAAVVAAGSMPVPTLALNVYPASPPPFLFQFSLDPEQEARAVARRIAEDGLVRGVALFPQNAWGQRLAAAFTAELQATGTTTLMAVEYYEPGARDFSGPLRAVLGRYGGAGDRSDGKGRPAPRRDPVAEAATGPQFAFVATTPQTARALRPQLRFQMTYDLAIYATSDAWDPSVRAAADMDGLVYPEMPWVLFGGQDAPELWEVVHSTWMTESRGRLRLYAFGFDAYQLAGQLRGSARSTGLAGLTGELEIAADGRVQRRLQFARIEGGRPQPLGTSAPPLPAPHDGAP
jgi:outer membrane PBP1 activator LpoA protein